MSCLLMILITRIELLEGKGVVGVALEGWREGSLFRFRGRLVEVVVVDRAVLDRLDFGLEIIGVGRIVQRKRSFR
uniref:Uncharacterized protein n=1 Tax=Salix viminalis TaxID=40686 RepID=A0A6N2LTR5_SALVM